MTTALNTNELGQAKLKLRDDLEFTLQEYGGVTCYVIEDRTRSRFFRIGTAEYTFLSLLDGTIPLSEAIGITAETLGQDAFSEFEAAAICKWLVDSQLATTDDALQVERLLDAGGKVQRQAYLRWLNPLILKIPLGNPQPVLNRLMPWLGAFATRPLLVLWAVLLGTAGVQLSRRWTQLASDAHTVFARDNWLWLLVAILVLKLLHELAHAVTCKRFGGTVREAGVVLVLFAPIPYVDVTSSWRFPSKWQRIAVSAAGMYAELLVASLAVLVWSHAGDPLLRHQAYNVMVAASLTTLIFNANFLMRFDGYYILADLLAIPNLYSLGQQYLKFLGRRYLLGVDAQPPQWPLGKDAVVRLYAIASFCWRLVVCVTLVAAAGALFDGAGLVLALAATMTWLGLPLWRLAKYLLGATADRPRPLRLALALSVLTVMSIACLALPVPGTVKAPAIVRYSSSSIVRASVSGFVTETAVTHGDAVVEGDVLLRLANPKLQQELGDLALAMRQAELRARQFHRAGELAAYQAEQRRRQSLEERLSQLQTQASQLVVRAPQTGRVITADVDSLRGRHVDTGGTLLEIADETRKELVALVAQQDADHFAPDTRLKVTPLAFGGSSLSSAVTTIEPAADSTLPSAALAGVYGGPLAVRQQDHPSHDASWELIEPRVRGTIALSEEQSAQLMSGQLAMVRLRDSRRRVYDLLLDWALSWPASRALLDRATLLLPVATATP